jgi:FlaA1/EpsC-like NDP-sugar epimerase
MSLAGQRILVTGGTGSIGTALVRRLLANNAQPPAKIVVFSRDEEKQRQMRAEFSQPAGATRGMPQFCLGDVRDAASVAQALRDTDVVFHAAAMKQVPTGEYSPFEAVRTNVIGAENIVRAIQEHGLAVSTVVGISTDKACKPVSAMGMSKALQERIFIHANLRCPKTRFVCVRCGNVLGSRGSVVPFFLEQIRAGGPVTITSGLMTRFLFSLDDAVDAILAAAATALAGETYIPRAPSARVADLAQALIAGRRIATKIVGLRPGEKLHEILLGEEEAARTTQRTIARRSYYVIRPMLPELCSETGGPNMSALAKEYSSADAVMTLAETAHLLRAQALMLEDGPKKPKANSRRRAAR